jgi:hypothetical protein
LVLTLEEQRQECNEEHQEDTDDAAVDPVADGLEVVAPALRVRRLTRVRVLALFELRRQGTDEDD